MLAQDLCYTILFILIGVINIYCFFVFMNFVVKEEVYIKL